MRQQTFRFLDSLPVLPRPSKPPRFRPRRRVRSEEMPLFELKIPARPVMFTDQEIGRHRASETAERNKILANSKRCGGCGGLVYQFPCLTCMLRGKD